MYWPLDIGFHCCNYWFANNATIDLSLFKHIFYSANVKDNEYYSKN